MMMPTMERLFNAPSRNARMMCIGLAIIAYSTRSPFLGSLRAPQMHWK
jgi:hypothetical protein